MLNRSFTYMGVTALLLFAVPAHGHDACDTGGTGGTGGFESELTLKAALTLARIADADDSGDVTGPEWKDFVDSLHPEPNGVISADALLAVLPLPAPVTKSAGADGAFADFITLVYDRDGDGKVETWDLAALFLRLDTNGDGTLSVLELAVAQGGLTGDQDAKALALLLAHAADADGSGDVTAEEWASFKASLHPDANGIISPSALIAALSIQAPGAKSWWRGDDDDEDEGDDEQGDDDDDDDDDGDGNCASSPPPEITPLVTHLFDRDFDGRIGTDDLDALFALLDTDGDGALSSTEIAPVSALKRTRAPALGLLVRAADADHDHRATTQEVTAFLADIGANGATGSVDVGLLASALPPSPRLAADPERRMGQIVKLFDLDRDRVLTLSDLRTIFSALDLNDDGTIGPSELRRARRFAK